MAGLIEASVYNILSSNIINFVQYLFSIFLNQNQKKLKNKALKIDIILVMCTIIIPIVMTIFNVDFNIKVIPLFIILFIFFYYLNFKVHQFYLENNLEKLNKDTIDYNKLKTNKIKKEKDNKIRRLKILIYIVFLICISGVLYFIGNNLNIVLSKLCNLFNIPEQLIGFTLGFVTSIPELITFFESQKEYKKTENSELGVIEATNNLLTSNILNLFVVQTISIVIFVIIW